MFQQKNVGSLFKNDFVVDCRVSVRPYNQKELASLYQVRDRTIAAWLKPFRDLIGEQKNGAYTVRQVEIIFVKLGVPYSLFEK